VRLDARILGIALIALGSACGGPRQPEPKPAVPAPAATPPPSPKTPMDP